MVSFLCRQPLWSFCDIWQFSELKNSCQLKTFNTQKFVLVQVENVQLFIVI